MTRAQNKEAIKRLEKAVAKMEFGTKLTFSELTLIAGVNVITHRSIVACANRHLMRHHERCLVNIYGVGYRVDPSDHAPTLTTKELGVPPRNYEIVEVSQLDDGKGGQPALLVTYKEADGKPTDAAVINHLLTRRKPS